MEFPIHTKNLEISGNHKWTGYQISEVTFQIVRNSLVQVNVQGNKYLELVQVLAFLAQLQVWVLPEQPSWVPWALQRYQYILVLWAVQMYMKQ